jgi:hypothetical protein
VPVNADLGRGEPSWDVCQLEVILEAPSTWQLVIAGPGAGKSAVACARIAYLVDEGIPPSRILLVSFTRTAVAELRDRIVSYAVAGDQARSVRISTIDSHAWSLRIGFDDQPLPKSVVDSTYDLSIQRTTEMLRSGQPDLVDFLSRLEHLIVDEAQDVMGLRGDLMLEMLKRLPSDCGVTILADPDQAIYGFTTDAEDAKGTARSLLDRLDSECPRPLTRRGMTKIHRIDGASSLTDVFVQTRSEIDSRGTASGHVDRVQQTIRRTCGNEVGNTTHEGLAEFLARVRQESMLVLFRHRADVLLGSSYCSGAGVEHRLRMSDMPVVVRPWLGWLLGEWVAPFINKGEFEQLWQTRQLLAPPVFAGEERTASWTTLHRLAAGARPETLDLVQLRRIVSRARPPLDLCYPDLGPSGPILGTIHASKGREADAVILVMPPRNDNPAEANQEADTEAVFEEGRVYYVGATRARQRLATMDTRGARVGYLDSGRVYRRFGSNRAQLEVGRDGDMDKTAHLAWSNRLETQRTLASCVGQPWPVKAATVPEEDYALRLILERKSDRVTELLDVGQLSRSFQLEMRHLWGRIDGDQQLRPPDYISHLYLVAVATVGLTESEQDAVKPPFSQSGLGLAAVIKGFPMIQFLHRSHRGAFR